MPDFIELKDVAGISQVKNQLVLYYRHLLIP